MTHYVLRPSEPSSPVNKIVVYGPFLSREGAVAYAAPTDYIIGSEADVIWTGRTLVDVFNGVTGSSVARFATNEAGCKRLVRELPNHALPSVEPERKTKMETETKTETPTPKRRGRQPAPGRTSGREQMDRYNAVVDEGNAKGMNLKRHTSTFEHYDKGEERIAALRSKVDAYSPAAA